jgi:predicted Zn-ribbon and HTH transcriptional regulator
MSLTLEMFAKPPRKKPRVMMHVTDAGTSGLRDEEGEIELAEFRCGRCGYETDWERVYTPTEVRRGHPCPRCNQGAS